MSDISGVQKASQAFYAALNRMANGNAEAMKDVWSQSASATAQHPIGGLDLGTGTILESFGKVASIAESGNVELVDQRLDVGTDMAVETGIERGTLTLASHTAAIDQRVTNIYRLEAGVWKIRHHHTDLAPTMLNILARLGAPD